MNTAQYNHLFSFIWNIANDVLVHAFEKGEYKKIIMPMTVLRRLDILLEPTKDAVLERKAQLDKAGISNQEPVLFQVTGYPFCNTSRFTMKKLKAEVDPKRLKMNFIEYLNGYSKDVQDIIDKFRLRQQVDNLTDAERLGSIIDKFTDSSINLSIKPVLDDKGREILPALDNHMMGTLFEELLRKFNEENNVTEAGEHFTPRDYVKLLADLAIIPIADQIEDNTYSIYDGACGTGGILTISEEEMKRLAKERGRKININIFGQELQPETFATCKADLMISGERRAFDYILNGSSRQYIAFGSTISEDGHKGETYDFCISNPPFGTPWKEDLKKWGLAESEKKKISDPRFKFVYDDDPEFNVIPDIGDPQMLFLANNIVRMKNQTKLGTRIVEVHNGSSLFNGDAGSGESNLRKYIIENDLLEAIVAMPENTFYNTGIGTFVWILTNKKEARRKGMVQLIDARQIKTPIRKNLGEKRCETNEDDRKEILNLLLDYKETPISKILPNDSFGYWDVPLLRPDKDDNGKVLRDKKGKVKLKKIRNVFERIPFTYPGGINGFYKDKIAPFDTEIEFGEPEIGYEILFEKIFYTPVSIKHIKDVSMDLINIEKDTAGMLHEILDMEKQIKTVVLKGIDDEELVETGIPWIGAIPKSWEIRRVRDGFFQKKEKAQQEDPVILSLARSGVKVRDISNFEGQIAESYFNYNPVVPGDFILNPMDLYSGANCNVSEVSGVISPAYITLGSKKGYNPKYYDYYFKVQYWLMALFAHGKGVSADNRWTINTNTLMSYQIPYPPLEVQNRIVEYITSCYSKIDLLIEKLKLESDELFEFKKSLTRDSVFCVRH